MSPHQPGWRRLRRGRGFSYVDEQGRPLGADDVQRIKDLVIPPAWDEVWISPVANGHLQSVGRDEAGRRQYLYHPAWREQQDAKKFERVIAMARRLPAARARLQESLSSETLVADKETALATAVRLVDLGCFRLGDEAYTETYGSHGLTTLECRHVSGRAGGVVFEFVGKSGIDHLIEMTDPQVCRALAAMRRSRRKDARLLAYRGGKGWVPLTSDEVNGAVRDLIGLDVTAKDFRTWHATVRVAAALGREPRAGTQAKRNKQVRSAIVEASEFLGNTPTVAKNSYVHPRVIDLFEDDHTIAATVRRLDPDPVRAQNQLDRAVVRLLS